MSEHGLNELDKPLHVVKIDPNQLPEIEYLRWQCRRGLLELDFLLEYFLEHSYSTLVPELKTAFVTLLSYPDPLIHEWVNGISEPEPIHLNTIIKLIRAQRI